MTLLTSILSFLLFFGFSGQLEISSKSVIPEGVYFILDPECPLSKRFTKYVNEIDSKGLKVSVVFMDKNKSRVDNFIATYLSRQIVRIDDGSGEMAQSLGATVFPQSFLVDEEGKVRYSGLINNWYSSLSRKRRGPSKHYLQNAIDEYSKGKVISTPFVEPIGCYIEYSL